MEVQKPGSDNDSDIIIIDDAQETIPIKGILRKPKTKKQHKRKVTLAKALNTMIIQRKVKRKKFIHIINISSVFRERCPDSIIRFARNECKKEAYYNRIVPSCRRNDCFPNDLAVNCCRSARHREYGIEKAELKVPTKRSGIHSPISSISLADSFSISLEDVSDNSFRSEEELDTLIKRTKERENRLTYPFNLCTAPFASTPIPADVASTYSPTSPRSMSTLVLEPLETEAYSPTTSPDYICNVSVPYSPTMTPDLMDEVRENVLDYKRIASPYSPTDPTETPNFSETEMHVDYQPEKDGRASLYSEASPPWGNTNINNENKKDIGCIVNNIKDEREVQTEMNENNNYVIKIENIKREKENETEVYHNENWQSFLKRGK